MATCMTRKLQRNKLHCVQLCSHWIYQIYAFIVQ